MSAKFSDIFGSYSTLKQPQFMPRIVIFASGSGTNAQNICEYFKSKEGFKVVALFCNKRGAGVLERASLFNVPSYIFSRADCYENGKLLRAVKAAKPDLIVLAGFLWLIPESLINAFPKQIVNIHPALLPDYGGKGMYGMKVHERVVANQETETGITIHYVNAHYDEGAIIFQAKCEVKEGDTPKDVAEKVHALEYTHFPEVIEKILVDQKN